MKFTNYSYKENTLEDSEGYFYTIEDVDLLYSYVKDYSISHSEFDAEVKKYDLHVVLESDYQDNFLEYVNELSEKMEDFYTLIKKQ